MQQSLGLKGLFRRSTMAVKWVMTQRPNFQNKCKKKANPIGLAFDTY